MKPVMRIFFIKLNTCELCWMVPWGFPPDRKRTSTCTSVGSDTICWAVLSCTPIPLLEAADAIYTLSAELIQKCVTRLFAFIIRLWRGQHNTDLLSRRDSRRKKNKEMLPVGTPTHLRNKARLGHLDTHYYRTYWSWGWDCAGQDTMFSEKCWGTRPALTGNCWWKLRETIIIVNYRYYKIHTELNESPVSFANF